MNFAPSTPYVSVRWSGDALGTLELLDQTLLPDRTEMIQCADEAQLHEAIVALRVRGAPAIGIAAAYGVVLALQPLVREKASIEQATRCAKEACAYLATSRPTAVNLFWALDRMQRLIERNANLASAGDGRIWNRVGRDPYRSLSIQKYPRFRRRDPPAASRCTANDVGASAAWRS